MAANLKNVISRKTRLKICNGSIFGSDAESTCGSIFRSDAEASAVIVSLARIREQEPEKLVG